MAGTPGEPPPDRPGDRPPEPGGDALPDDLDVTAGGAGYTFPDVRRRRIAGILYLLLGGLCAGAGLAAGSGGVLVNGGTVAVGLVLVAVGVHHVATAWPLAVRDAEALVAAARRVGFPVGYASAQLGWRGLLSRPTWRVLVYSAEERPEHRALVLVDGVDGRVLSHFTEENPEDWPGG